MNPLYKPTGKAKEYGDYAVNIYTGCPHKCFYCFAPKVLHKEKETFHNVVEPRKDICAELKKQLEREHITDKLVHLCFTCDPYPKGYDSSVTREIIKVLKDRGNHVQILTKNTGERDFDLLDSNDWYGITFDGDMKHVVNPEATRSLIYAHYLGIKTWVSFEPVIDAECVLDEIYFLGMLKVVDKVKIGKLNYYQSNIDWKRFGEKAEKICKGLGLDYYIKESLREEMDE